MTRSRSVLVALLALCVAIVAGLCSCAQTSNATNSSSNATAYDQPPAASDKMHNFDNPTTVLCFGDSNTWGFIPGTGKRYSETQRWPRVLATMLGNGYQILEEGLNGRTTAFDVNGSSVLNGLSALPSVLVLDKPVDVVVLMLGTNDCVQDLRPSEIATGLEKLVTCVEETCAKEQGFVPEIIIVSPAPTLSSDDKDDEVGESDAATLTATQKSRQLSAFYAQVASDHGCTLVVSDAEVSTIDKTHLTEAGHHRVAELVADALLN